MSSSGRNCRFYGSGFSKNIHIAPQLVSCPSDLERWRVPCRFFQNSACVAVHFGELPIIEGNLWFRGPTLFDLLGVDPGWSAARFPAVRPQERPAAPLKNSYKIEIIIGPHIFSLVFDYHGYLTRTLLMSVINHSLYLSVLFIHQPDDRVNPTKTARKSVRVNSGRTGGTK